MAQSATVPHRRGFRATLRTDAWWLEPALMGAALTLLLGYLVASAFLDGWKFEVGPYLSPVYEPKLHGAFRAWWFSPSLLILWGPIGFRATCYYLRRAYYRSYFLSPPACAVADLGRAYQGERRFPLIIQNLHRFFMYVALVFIPILWISAIRAYHNPGEGWGVGLGSVLLTADAFLVTMYTFGCHSLRHLVGGGLDCFSCSRWARSRKRVWDYVTRLNEHHRFWFWISLSWLAATDLYIRLVANGVITDPNTWKGF